MAGVGKGTLLGLLLFVLLSQHLHPFFFPCSELTAHITALLLPFRACFSCPFDFPSCLPRQGGLECVCQLADMSFKVEDFVARLYESQCSKVNLCAGADNYEVSMSTRVKRHWLQSELAFSLSSRGILSPVATPGAPATQPVREEVHQTA